MKVFAVIIFATLSGVGVCAAQYTAPAQPKPQVRPQSSAPDSSRPTISVMKMTMHPPAPGSYFRVKGWWTSADRPPIGPHYSTDSVIERGDTFEGKDNVLVFQMEGPHFTALQRISYERNGDISWYEGSRRGSEEPGGWERFPLASHDTVVFLKGKNSFGDLVVDTESFLESKDTTIEGHFWHAIKIREIVSLAGHAFNNEVLWFDAETGWYLRMDMPPRHPFRPELPSNGEEVHVYDCKIEQ